MKTVGQLLELAGIGKERLQLRWVSSSEGPQFAGYVTELTELVRGLGPLEAEARKLSLAAVQRALQAPSLRWLMGMERHLTERGNVYQEKLEPAAYENLLNRAAEAEFQRALIFESLVERPRTVRAMADLTGLPTYTISLRLNDLERSGQVGLRGHEGTSPIFAVLTA